MFKFFILSNIFVIMIFFMQIVAKVDVRMVLLKTQTMQKMVHQGSPQAHQPMKAKVTRYL